MDNVIAHDALDQGSDAWHTHRAAHWNASDAPAMLGLSDALESRDALINRLAFGSEQDHRNEFARQRMADGHAYEALARPLADEHFGIDLTPGVFTRGRISASVDGYDVITCEPWEHKAMNADLRAAFKLCAMGGPFTATPRVCAQAEQIMLVMGVASCYFTASKWDGEHCEEIGHAVIHSDPALRQRIIDGWVHLERDIEAARANGPKLAPPELMAKRVEKLPVLRIETQPGKVLASNLDAFKTNAFAVIAELPSVLRTDQDFVDGNEAVKYLTGVERSCTIAKESLFSGDLEALANALDAVSDAARQKRLALAKQVEDNRLTRRHELIAQASKAFAEQVGALSNDRRVQQILGSERAPDWAFAIKGKSSIASMQQALTEQLDASLCTREALAERLIANFATIDAAEQRFTLDWKELALRDPDYVRLEMERRAKAEAERLAKVEADRLTAEQKRREQEAERARLAAIAEQRARDDAQEAARAEALRLPEAPTQPAPSAGQHALRVEQPAPVAAAPVEPARNTTISLGEINCRLDPITVSEAGLKSIGVLSVGTDRNKKLYADSDFGRICYQLLRVIERAQTESAP